MAGDTLLSALFAAVPEARVRQDVPMKTLTSFRIGGPADIVATVENASELAGAWQACRHHGVAPLVIGRGTNLLVRDGGVRGVVIRLAGEFAVTEFEGETVIAGAAMSLSHLVRECGRRGLAGLENAVGIPGSVGGAVIMNAGAYGLEMKNVVESATFFIPDRLPPVAGEPVAAVVAAAVTLSAPEIEFGYRTSRPSREGWVVLRARFHLTAGDPAEIRAREEETTALRKKKQPLDLPSAGSVFKRPPGGYAGTLIDQCGCKGLRVGDAQVSELHANFIVNLGEATARDVLTLIDEVRRRVHDSSGIWLEPEVKVVGEDR